jgi:hypothetical protein
MPFHVRYIYINHFHVSAEPVSKIPTYIIHSMKVRSSLGNAKEEIINVTTKKKKNKGQDDGKDKKHRKVYELPGQKHDPPEEVSLFIFFCFHQGFFKVNFSIEYRKESSIAILVPQNE